MIEVLQPGMQTTIQDVPGRIGYLDRGFFPAGPMDDLSFRLANALVGNAADAAGLEVTLGNLALRFDEDCRVAVTGAPLSVTVDGTERPMWQRLEVRAGQVLRLAVARTVGFRIYLAVEGGIQVPEVLGSSATYTMGAIGGLEGRALRKNDVLRFGTLDGTPVVPATDPAQPSLTNDWELEVVLGPHCSEEFLTDGDLELLFEKKWSVDRNSNRTGIRLDSQRLKWARETGGIAGGHPSNILDTGYPLGGINLNGDTPVILGPDGPTSGGFVVFAVVARASMWKLGQMRPGRDTVKFRPISLIDAQRLWNERHTALSPSQKEGK